MNRLAVSIILLAAASPAASQTTPREIAEIADISGLTPSPDGKWLAYRIERPSTTTNEITVDWYVVATDADAKARHLGRIGSAMWNDAGVVLPGEAHWMPDGDTLIVRAQVGGRIGLWKSSAVAPGFRPAVEAEGDVEAFAVLPDGGILTQEGPSQAVIAAAEERERATGVLVDASVDLGQPVYHGALVNGRPATQRFMGDWFDRGPLLAGAPRAINIRSFDGGVRAATEEEGTLLAGPADTDLDLRIGELLERHGACPKSRPCDAGASHLVSRASFGDGRTLITLSDPAGRQSLYVASADRRTLRLVARSAGQLSGDRSNTRPCAIAGGALFCVEASASQPPRLLRFSIGGAQRVVANPNPIPDSDGLLAETIAWQVGGSRASGVLIRPKIPGRLPLFITYYRCNGYLRGGTGDEWPLRAFAANGIAALCIDVLPGGANAEERYRVGLETVRSAVEHLDRRGAINRSRVGMGGLSFGSEVAMWTSMNSDLLKAVSIASVQIEPGYYWFNARPGRETFADALRQNWDLGPPDSEPARWEILSAASNIDRINAPVLLQLPESEARQSTELMNKLMTARKGELHVFPLAPHIKVEPRQKLAAYQRNLDWFRFWLKGEIDPDPAKAAQYQRWRNLRGAKGAASTP